MYASLSFERLTPLSVSSSPSRWLRLRAEEAAAGGSEAEYSCRSLEEDGARRSGKPFEDNCGSDPVELDGLGEEYEAAWGAGD